MRSDGEARTSQCFGRNSSLRMEASGSALGVYVGIGPFAGRVMPDDEPAHGTSSTRPIRTAPDQFLRYISDFLISSGRFRTCPDNDLVPLAGIEPALLAELDFESSASTNSTTGARFCGGRIIIRTPRGSTSHGGGLPIIVGARASGSRAVPVRAGRAARPQRSACAAGSAEAAAPTDTGARPCLPDN